MSSADKITEMPPGKGVEDKRYPEPLASHEDVVRNPTVFWETLRRFHSILALSFIILRVPVIGGKELDLHVLYVEVTRRGGFDKVVGEKKWRDVGAVFSFSPTTTSASFVLRKHYSSLLRHYEQVYFFKLQGPLLTSTVTLPVKDLACRPLMPDLTESVSESMQEHQEQIPHKRMRSSPHLHNGAGSCFPVIGTIDGKFDCGYLVTVKLGSEVLRGVLYHPPSPSSSTSTIQPNSAIIPCNSKPQPSGRRRRGRRWGDPSHPKPNRSGYNFFFAEKHSKLKSLYPAREREFTKMIGESWSKLSQEERMVYQNIGLKDKERYKRELKEYKEGLKLLQPMEAKTADS
ncbi:hypothetical protein HHK36_010384 [Tetracentron sinense]|uniref:High mobility group B protein 9 n=1 Tax=Tetracentron sinense TaxID=13715 RepID=A0A835DJ40_TETSI|nr:hypothetical protein HHK36_010384 [Tetracentron sinense]